MSNEKYNGWTNYATWRVQLEIVSDYVENELQDDLENVKDMTIAEWASNIEGFVDEVVGFEQQDGFAYNYAMAFLNQVDYNELARHAHEEAQERAKELENAKK